MMDCCRTVASGEPDFPARGNIAKLLGDKVEYSIYRHGVFDETLDVPGVEHQRFLSLHVDFILPVSKLSRHLISLERKLFDDCVKARVAILLGHPAVPRPFLDIEVLVQGLYGGGCDPSCGRRPIGRRLGDERLGGGGRRRRGLDLSRI